ALLSLGQKLLYNLKFLKPVERLFSIQGCDVYALLNHANKCDWRLTLSPQNQVHLHKTSSMLLNQLHVKWPEPFEYIKIHPLSPFENVPTPMPIPLHLKKRFSY